MNIELIMAFFVLYSGLNIVYRVLKMGSPENELKNRIKKLEEFKEASKRKGAYLTAWVIGLLVGVFLIYISLSWMLPHFK